MQINKKKKQKNKQNRVNEFVPEPWLWTMGWCWKGEGVCVCARLCVSVCGGGREGGGVTFLCFIREFVDHGHYYYCGASTCTATLS